jgi:high-affinity Fe2+/Pb2+ permease
MTDPTPSTARRVRGTVIAIVIGVVLFTLLTRLTGALIGITIAGDVVIVVVGVVAAIVTPRRRRRRQQER